MKNNRADKKGYLLELQSGDKWWLAAEEAVVPWLKRLAAIMELKEVCNEGYRRLIFAAMENGHNVYKNEFTLSGECKQDRLNNGWILEDYYHYRFWRNKEHEDVIFELKLIDDEGVKVVNMWNSLHPIQQSCIDSGGLSMHAALIERNGRGVLLAGSGGEGKSTCCRRLPDSCPIIDSRNIYARNFSQFSE